MSANDKRWLTTAEAAEMLRVPVFTLRKWCSHRKLNYIRLGRRSLFDPAELERFVESGLVPRID